MSLEKKNISTSSVNHKQEIINLQNKYLEAMKDMQKSFEAFKFKKEEEVR